MSRFSDIDDKLLGDLRLGDTALLVVGVLFWAAVFILFWGAVVAVAVVLVGWIPYLYEAVGNWAAPYFLGG